MNPDGTPESGASPSAPVATFHARVAGVGLFTTVVVLLAACLTFMLQQWAVARTQAHNQHASLASLIASSAAPSLDHGEPGETQAALGALKGVRGVLVARLTDADGKVLAAYRRGGPAPTKANDIEEITA